MKASSPNEAASILEVRRTIKVTPFSELELTFFLENGRRGRQEEGENYQLAAQDVLDMPVDPNEPTYCSCHQVSYGEMIGCDNPDVSLSKSNFKLNDFYSSVQSNGSTLAAWVSSRNQRANGIVPDASHRHPSRAQKRRRNKNSRFHYFIDSFQLIKSFQLSPKTALFSLIIIFKISANLKFDNSESDGPTFSWAIWAGSTRSAHGWTDRQPEPSCPSSIVQRC